MGRPKKEIDYDILENLMQIQCTQSEICSVFNITDKTLLSKIKEHYGEDMDFMELYKIHSEKGKTSLRRAQYKVALNGNTTMLIWLGKQYLGQKEPDTKQEMSIENLQTLADMLGINK